MTVTCYATAKCVDAQMYIPCNLRDIHHHQLRQWLQLMQYVGSHRQSHTDLCAASQRYRWSPWRWRRSTQQQVWRSCDNPMARPRWDVSVSRNAAAATGYMLPKRIVVDAERGILLYLFIHECQQLITMRRFRYTFVQMVNKFLFSLCVHAVKWGWVGCG